MNGSGAGDGQRDDSSSERTMALGRLGENLAAAWYEERGYSLTDRNWRSRRGEIDLIAEKDNVLVICEVKSRAQARYGTPAEAVTPAKRHRLRLLATEWLATRSGAGHPRDHKWYGEIRFDVACIVTGPGGRYTIDVIERAF